MKVRIYNRDSDGNPEELGAIVLKDELVPEPNIPSLNNRLGDPLIVYEKTTRILIDHKKRNFGQALSPLLK